MIKSNEFNNLFLITVQMELFSVNRNRSVFKAKTRSPVESSGSVACEFLLLIRILLLIKRCLMTGIFWLKGNDTEIRTLTHVRSLKTYLALNYVLQQQIVGPCVCVATR